MVTLEPTVLFGSRKEPSSQITTFPPQQKSLLIKSGWGRGVQKIRMEERNKQSLRRRMWRWDVKKEGGQLKGFAVVIEKL